jgi:uncharacterized protein YtpQ (UPF0354 family)
MDTNVLAFLTLRVFCIGRVRFASLTFLATNGHEWTRMDTNVLAFLTLRVFCIGRVRLASLTFLATNGHECACFFDS